MGEEFKGGSIPYLSRAKSPPWTGRFFWVGSSEIKSDANSHRELWWARLLERGFCDQNLTNLQSKSSSLCHSKAPSWGLFDIKVHVHEWFEVSLIFWQFLLSKLHDETFLAGQAVHIEMLKNLFLHLFASKERLVFMGVFFPILWGCEGFTVFAKCGVFLGEYLSQDKKNAWKISLAMEECDLNLLSSKPASLTQNWAPVCRSWTFPYESASLHSCSKLWHEVV